MVKKRSKRGNKMKYRKSSRKKLKSTRKKIKGVFFQPITKMVVDKIRW